MLTREGSIMEKSDLKRFINPEVLFGERIVLRKMTTKDIDDVFEYASDSRVSQYLLWCPHKSREFTKKYLSFIDRKYKKAEFYDYAIEYKGKMIGTCGFTSFSIENGCGEIGFVLNPSYWGMGIAKEAAELVIKYGFEVLGLNRIEARYMAENRQSGRVMEKCNMKFEGVLRSQLLVKGTYRDIGIYSILRSEYFAEK